MKYKSILYIALLLLTSCHFYHVTPTHIKDNDNFKYSSSSTDTILSKVLNTNGYFHYNDTMNSGLRRSSNINIMFFEDGMFVSDFYSWNKETREVGEEMPRYFDEILELRKKGERNYNFYESSAWGYYKVYGDTIKAKYINRPPLDDECYTWYDYDIWYKIIDKNHLMEIYKLPFTELKIIDNEFMNSESNRKIYYYCPLPKKPESDGWIKYKRWFWLNSKDFKEWRKTMKEK